MIVDGGFWFGVLVGAAGSSTIWLVLDSIRWIATYRLLRQTLNVLVTASTSRGGLGVTVQSETEETK